MSRSGGPDAASSTPVPPVRPREIVGWAMFDFANSSYTTVIVTVAFSVFFTRLVAPGGAADFLWSVGISISNLMVVVSSPLVGAIADDLGRKKSFMAATYALCVAGTAALYFVLPGEAAFALTLFVISNVAYSLGENLNAAFLPEITTPATIGRISGFGWGLGYFGGLLSLLAVRPLLTAGFTLENLTNLRRVWLATALFFLVAALPTFAFLRERAPRAARCPVLESAARGAARIAATARSLGHFAQLARFLVVFFVYSCGLMTVIAFAGIFAANTLGFTGDELIVLFLVLQLSSAAGAFLFGLLQDRLGSKATIQITLVFWLAVCVATYLCETKTLFWAIALVAGLGVGSQQTASRALVGLFSPLEKSGEFFGFWGLAQKAAYATGPLVFGAISSASGSQRIAILATGLFFAAGLLGMLAVDQAKGRAAAASWRP